jgi:hypothetical protein
MPDFLKKFFHSTKNSILKLLKGRGSSRQIALGFAIGVFIGVFPTFGLGLILYSGLAIFIKFNLQAAILGGVLSTNPLTTPICIAASYRIGQLITGSRIKFKIVDNEFIYNLKNFRNFGFNYLTGNFILSLGLAIISYFVVKTMVDEYRKKRKKSSR